MMCVIKKPCCLLQQGHDGRYITKKNESQNSCAEVEIKLPNIWHANKILPPPPIPVNYHSFIL